MLASLPNAGGNWFHLSGAVGDCESDTVCMLWECYVETSQRECMTPQFLTLSFHAGDSLFSLVGTYLAYGQGTLDLLSSWSTGLNSLYLLAWGGGWG